MAFILQIIYLEHNSQLPFFVPSNAIQFNKYLRRILCQAQFLVLKIEKWAKLTQIPASPRLHSNEVSQVLKKIIRIKLNKNNLKIKIVSNMLDTDKC